MSHTNERQKHTGTPRTDAASFPCAKGYYSDEVVHTPFARQLEMELNDISTELRQAREQIESLKEHNLQLYDTMVERGKQVERLKDALLAIRDYDGPDRGGEYRIARDTLERIDSAMAEQPVNSSLEREPVANHERQEVERLKRDVAKAVADFDYGIGRCGSLWGRLKVIGITPAMAEGGAE